MHQLSNKNSLPHNGLQIIQKPFYTLVTKPKKPYIFPEEQFDPETVPTPWFNFIAGMTDKEKSRALGEQRVKARRWIVDNWHRFDDEDKDYVLDIYGMTYMPLVRHESMNFLAIMKQFFT